MELVYPKEVPLFNKYDEFLPAELVRKGFAYGVLNIDEMTARVKEWTDTPYFLERKEANTLPD